MCCKITPSSFSKYQTWDIKIISVKELYDLVTRITRSIENTTLWSQNSLLVDGDHWWTCALSIECDDISYMYAFRYNIEERKLYGSPFKIIDDVNSLDLNYSSNPALFTIFNKALSIIF